MKSSKPNSNFLGEYMQFREERTKRNVESADWDIYQLETEMKGNIFS